MAENEENEECEWVGCQWLMQGFCGRRSAAQQGTGEKTRAAEPLAKPEPKATVEPAAPAEPAVGPAPVATPEQPAAPAKRPKRKSSGTPRQDAWSAARKAAAAKRTRRPAA